MPDGAAGVGKFGWVDRDWQLQVDSSFGFCVPCLMYFVDQGYAQCTTHNLTCAYVKPLHGHK